MLGANLFAYCGNNPVNSIDSSGFWYINWDNLGLLVTAIFALILNLSFIKWNVWSGAISFGARQIASGAFWVFAKIVYLNSSTKMGWAMLAAQQYIPAIAMILSCVAVVYSISFLWNVLRYNVDDINKYAQRVIIK